MGETSIVQTSIPTGGLCDSNGWCASTFEWKRLVEDISGSGSTRNSQQEENNVQEGAR